MRNEALQILLENSKAAIANAHSSSAEVSVHELLAILESENQSFEKNDIELCTDRIIEYVTSLRTSGNAHKALSLSEKTLSVIENYKSKNSIVKLWTVIGLIHNSMSNYPLALEYLMKALAVYEELDNKSNIARIKGNIAIVYSSLSDYSKALDTFNQSLAIQEELGNKQEIARGLGNIGVVYESIGDYRKAMEYFSTALSTHEELDMKADIARVTGNIGSLHLYLLDYPRALECYTKAYEEFEALGIKTEAARMLGNIGSAYKNMSEYQTALEFYWKALASHNVSGNKAQIASVTGNIGSVYLQIEEFDKALEYFSKSLAIHEELGRKSSIALHKGNIGALYAEKKYEGYDPVKAEKYLLEAIAICEETGSNQSLYEICKILAELYELEKVYDKALYYHKQYHESEKKVLDEEIKKEAERAAYERKISEMKHEQDITEQILHNILPKEIAHRIRRGDEKIVDKYESVSVLFSDVVGFTELSQRVSPEQLVAALDGIFNTFDRLAEKHGCEKIKTIGDCYMVVAGLPQRCNNHAERLVFLAFDMLNAIKEFPVLVDDVPITMRIGLHTGSVVAGVIGKNKYSYDLWGDAVNTASRMESYGDAGKVHVSDDFVKFLKGTLNSLSPVEGNGVRVLERGELEIKGKGMMKTYFLEQSKPIV